MAPQLARQGAPADVTTRGIDRNAYATAVAGQRAGHLSRNLLRDNLGPKPHARPMSYRLTDARAGTVTARTYAYVDTWSTGTTHSVVRHAKPASLADSLRHDRAYTTDHDTATLSGLIT